MSYFRVFIGVCLLVVCVTAVAEAPAVPFIDGCTGALMGLAGAEYSLNQCLSGWAGMIPIAHCEPETAAVGHWQNQVNHWCNMSA